MDFKRTNFLSGRLLIANCSVVVLRLALKTKRLSLSPSLQSPARGQGQISVIQKFIQPGSRAVQRNVSRMTRLSNHGSSCLRGMLVAIPVCL